MTAMGNVRLARQEDFPEIVEIWHAGWHDAHAKLVPPQILNFRRIEHFRLWLESSTGEFLVAIQDNAVTGFVATNGSELVKLYVVPRTRGTGTAAALLASGERRIAENGFADAVLYCTAGNTRAERFYCREGWILRETRPDALWVPQDTNCCILVETHRFGKHVA